MTETITPAALRALAVKQECGYTGEPCGECIECRTRAALDAAAARIEALEAEVESTRRMWEGR